MATGSGGGNRKGKTWLFAVLFFLAPLITAIVPRLTPAMLALVAITIIVAALRQRAENGFRWKELLTPSAAFLACLAFSLYVFLNASWAWNQSAGFAKAALLLGVILVVFATASAVRAIDEQQVRSATIAFAAGAFLGAAYLALELLIDGAVMRLAMNTIPALQPDDIKRVTIVDGVVTRVSLNKLNQNITTIMLNAWPAMLMLSAAALRYRWGMVALFFAISAVAIFLSDHDSSQLALLGSVVVFALARRWQRWTVRGLAAVWCLAFALVVPVAHLAYEEGLHLQNSLPHSYRARIILWGYTAQKVLEHPVIGVGVNTTRERDNAGVNDRHKAPTPEGFAMPRTTAHHSHSLFLQTCYELGAIGAVLLSIAGALVVLGTTSLPRNAQPFAAATFAAFAVIAALAWGMWQTWWICAIALAAVYVCLAARADLVTGRCAVAREFGKQLTAPA